MVLSADDILSGAKTVTHLITIEELGEVYLREPSRASQWEIHGKDLSLVEMTKWSIGVMLCNKDGSLLLSSDEVDTVMNGNSAVIDSIVDAVSKFNEKNQPKKK